MLMEPTALLLKKNYEDKNAQLSCPSCDSEVRTVRYVYSQDDSKANIYQCNVCTFMFVRPVLIPTVTERQMDSVDDAEFFNNPFLKMLHEKIILKKEIFNVKKIIGNGNFTLLDVGCGTGWITKIWSDHGFEVTGLEPSEVRGKIAEENYGIRIISDYLENLDTSKKYNIVILRQVVEHLEDPQKMLAKALSLLYSGGVLLLITPNIQCIGRYIFDTKWSWILPYHCNFFSPKSLRTIVQKAGFDIQKDYQTPSPLWYPESFLRLFPKAKTLSAALYKKLSLAALLPFMPLVLIGHLVGLSDNMTVIARKNN